MKLYLWIHKKDLASSLQYNTGGTEDGTEDYTDGEAASTTMVIRCVGQW